MPEPVYIVERFDRFRDEAGHTQRLHIIDACQLLAASRVRVLESLVVPKMMARMRPG